MAALIGQPPIAGVLLSAPEVHADPRGSFAETYRHEWFPAFVPVQMNHSERAEGSIVGLHWHRKQTDYWYVSRGTARIVLHDLRERSPSEGKTWTLDTDRPCGVLIPPGVAHGFAALTDVTLIYLIDRYYDPSDELGVAWNDPEIGADWGIAEPLLSNRDKTNPLRKNLPPRRCQ